jgi:hypothetical protein
MPDHMIRAELNLPIEEQEVAPPASTEGEEESKEDITDVVTDKATDEAVATTQVDSLTPSADDAPIDKVSKCLDIYDLNCLELS